MVKLIDELCVSDSTAHISWSTEQPKQLPDSAKHRIRVAQFRNIHSSKTTKE